LNKPIIIAITGTKGKTSTARLIDFVLNQLGYRTLRVDSDGCFLNNKNIKTRKDSQRVYKKPPTVKSGKYLYLANRNNTDYAILEQSISSGKLENGLGYKEHDFSIFTNVYSDHIDYKIIKNSEDIYRLKLNILKKTKKNSWLIINYDNKYGKKLSEAVKINNKILFYGYSEKLLQCSDYLRAESDIININYKGLNYKVDIKTLSFPFNLDFKPAIYNLMASLGLLILLDIKISLILKALKNFTQNNFYGRLILKKFKGRKILFDTAHEHVSIIETAKLCKKIGKNLTGVLRVSPERTNRYIRLLAKKIALANIFDKLIIYDFIDGITRNESISKVNGKTRKVGETANIFTKGLKLYNYKNIKIETVLNEQKALEKTLESSEKNDVILFIHHKLKKDLSYLKKLSSS